MSAASDPRTFGLFLFGEAPALEFILFSECLSYANRLSGRTLYTCDAIALESPIFDSGCGVRVIPTSVPGELSNFYAVVVFGAPRSPDESLGEISSWLRYQARQGALIGSIANGARALARCGLLEGRRVALPRSSIAAFCEEFPDIETTLDLYVIDDQRFTCCGGTAALDLALHFIAHQHGADLAHYVADACVHDFLARSVQRQDSLMETRLSAADRRLYNAVKMMKEHLEAPLSIEHIACLAGTSVRQLQRLFRRYLSTTPCQHYMQLRLWRARSFLLETDLSVTEVSIASGFVSHSGFSARYRQAFERSPSEERSNKWDRIQDKSLGRAHLSSNVCNVTKNGGWENGNVRRVTT